MENNLTWQEFEKVSMHVGTIVEVKDFQEAKTSHQLI
jgi:tRNA-binding protein